MQGLRNLSVRLSVSRGSGRPNADALAPDPSPGCTSGLRPRGPVMSGGTDESPVRIYDAMLTPERLDELLADLGAHAKDLDVRVRRGTGRHSVLGKSDIGELGTLLSESSCTSVQIRYQFQGQVWCDSILRTPEGLRLVRTEMPSSGP